MNGPKGVWENPTWWSKILIQGIILYNCLYHKNIDPNIGVGIVSALEAIFHAGESLVSSAHAIKDRISNVSITPIQK